MPYLTRFEAPGAAEQWSKLGFVLDGSRFVLSHVAFEVGRDAQAWGFDELLADAAPLGVETMQADTPPDERPAHPNLIAGIDHVVYAVGDLDETIGVFDKVLGIKPRRRAFPRGPQGPEMAFFRVGDAIIEVAASSRVASPRLSGIAFRCNDLDATVAAVRAAGCESIGEPKPAVQGGRIASVWTGWTGMPIAVMEPPAKRVPDG